jgi:hypothetical protein
MLLLGETVFETQFVLWLCWVFFYAVICFKETEENKFASQTLLNRLGEEISAADVAVIFPYILETERLSL